MENRDIAFKHAQVTREGSRPMGEGGVRGPEPSVIILPEGRTRDPETGGGGIPRKAVVVQAAAMPRGPGPTAGP